MSKDFIVFGEPLPMGGISRYGSSETVLRAKAEHIENRRAQEAARAALDTAKIKGLEPMIYGQKLRPQYTEPFPGTTVLRLKGGASGDEEIGIAILHKVDRDSISLEGFVSSDADLKLLLDNPITSAALKLNPSASRIEFSAANAGFMREFALSQNAGWEEEDGLIRRASIGITPLKAAPVIERKPKISLRDYLKALGITIPEASVNRGVLVRMNIDGKISDIDMPIGAVFRPNKAWDSASGVGHDDTLVNLVTPSGPHEVIVVRGRYICAKTGQQVARIEQGQAVFRWYDYPNAAVWASNSFKSETLVGRALTGLINYAAKVVSTGRKFLGLTKSKAGGKPAISYSTLLTAQARMAEPELLRLVREARELVSSAPLRYEISERRNIDPSIFTFDAVPDGFVTIGYQRGKAPAVEPGSRVIDVFLSKLKLPGQAEAPFKAEEFLVIIQNPNDPPGIARLYGHIDPGGKFSRGNMTGILRDMNRAGIQRLIIPACDETGWSLLAGAGIHRTDAKAGLANGARKPQLSTVPHGRVPEMKYDPSALATPARAQTANPYRSRLQPSNREAFAASEFGRKILAIPVPSPGPLIYYAKIHSNDIGKKRIVHTPSRVMLNRIAVREAHKNGKLETGVIIQLDAVKRKRAYPERGLLVAVVTPSGLIEAFRTNAGLECARERKIIAMTSTNRGDLPDDQGVLGRVTAWQGRFSHFNNAGVQ